MAGERDDLNVTHVAALARLRLAPAEEALYRTQLADILAFVRQLQGVDTTGVPPAALVLQPATADRPDEVRPSLPPEAALGNAPDAVAAPHLVRVPKVLG